MASKVLKKIFPLEAIESDIAFYLRAVSEHYVFDSFGNRTNQIDGHTYDIVGCDSLESYRIVVPTDSQARPVMTSDEVLERRNQGEKIVVGFRNARIRAYYSSQSKGYEDSVRADEAFLVKAD